MTRSWGLAAGVCLALPLAAQQPVFRVVVDHISVDVAVTDGRRPVADLAAADFEVWDNGVAQTVRDVTYEAAPIDLTLLLDVSASVEGRQLQTLVRAVNRVGERLRPADRASLLAFNERVYELTRDAPAAALQAATARLRAGGSTSLYDALGYALIGERPAERRQMLMALTDGHDTLSALDPKMVVDAARRAPASIFFVMLDASVMARLSTPPLLDELAALSGGTVHRLAAGGDIGGAFLRAFDEFRTSYVLRYTATGVSRPGWHDIVVKVKRPGNFTVRARKGYVIGRSAIGRSGDHPITR